MKRIRFLLAAVVTLASVVAVTVPASLCAYQSGVPIFVTKISPRYPEGKLPFPEGPIIASLHYGHVPSEENNKVFGRPQRVLGPARNGTPVRFKVKLNGAAPGDDHGSDSRADGAGEVRQPRMYQLIRQKGSINDATFEIEFLDPGVEAFSFTFG